MHVLLMRHGKSSWKFPSLSDHDRPLKNRGRRDVLRMAGLLRERGLVPESIVASSAVRAQQTAEIIREELGISDITIEPALYHCKPEVWEDMLQHAPFERLSLWVGHNPGMEEYLTRSAGNTIAFPTSAVALLQRTQTSPGASFELVQMWTPKGT